MTELTCPPAIPQTPHELDEAVKKYQASNLTGAALLCEWQAIRDASLLQAAPEPPVDSTPGDDSY
jgi:hypothetical protein